jgi:glutaredoxin 3
MDGQTHAKPRVLMYTNTTCGWCRRARALLTDKGVPFTDINVDVVPGAREEMRLLSGRNTVPQVFIGPRPIGGYDDLYALEEKGELDKMLAAPLEA